VNRRAASLALLAALALPTDALAGACPAGALGTARVLEVDPTAGVFVGRKSYPDTLPLTDHEVVLTFDDGPAGATTDAVLVALAAECVQATFFVVGEMASARPAQLKKIVAAGHSVGTHSMTHPILAKLPQDTAQRQITDAWTTVATILNGPGGAKKVPPFFRYPGFAGTPALDQWLANHHVAVFGADLWGSDWAITDPDKLLNTVLTRLDETGGGILLLHDTKHATATMLSRLLATMKLRGFKVVHIVPKAPPA
jgi:peptidoglycan/xylan/chitin deacetylase (PgdA/CDA1 family)